MALEDTVATYNALAAQNLTLQQAVADAAIEQINAIGAEFQARQASMLIQRHVNTVTGSDAANGLTAGTPYQTVQKAIDACPPKGTVLVIMQSPLHVSEDIDCGNKEVRLRSSSSTRHAITFQQQVQIFASQNYRTVKRFLVGPEGYLDIQGLTITVPSLAAVPGMAAALTAADQHLIFGIKPFGTGLTGRISVMLGGNDIVIPADPSFSLISNREYPVDFYEASNIYPGAVTSPLGRIFAGITNTSGTAVNTLPWLRTNRTNV